MSLFIGCGRVEEKTTFFACDSFKESNLTTVSAAEAEKWATGKNENGFSKGGREK